MQEVFIYLSSMILLLYIIRTVIIACENNTQNVNAKCTAGAGFVDFTSELELELHAHFTIPTYICMSIH